jgi:transcriptional regulator with XRE-family HTH domain
MLTQTQLASSAGISLKTIQRYENGHKLPDAEIWKRILLALEITQEEFDNFDLLKVFEHRYADAVPHAHALKLHLEHLYINSLEEEVNSLRAINQELQQQILALLAAQS